MIRGWESTHVWRNDDNPVLTLAISINSSKTTHDKGLVRFD